MTTNRVTCRRREISRLGNGRAVSTDQARACYHRAANGVVVGVKVEDAKLVLVAGALQHKGDVERALGGKVQVGRQRRREERRALVALLRRQIAQIVRRALREDRVLQRTRTALRGTGKWLIRYAVRSRAVCCVDRTSRLTTSSGTLWKKALSISQSEPSCGL